MKRFFIFLLVALLIEPAFSFDTRDMSITDIVPFKSEGNLSVKKIKGTYLNGIHFIPKQITHKGIIITFGGSDGGANVILASDIADKGYEVLAIHFFGQENQNKTLSQIPLEFFSEVLNYANQGCKSVQMITVVGSSKGAELVLLLTNYYSEITAVAAFAPSSYVFESLDYGGIPKSSWTWKNRDIPFIPYGRTSYQNIKYENNCAVLRGLYEKAVADTPKEDLEKAKINIKNFKGSILLFAGGKDALWQSDVMAKILKEDNPNAVDMHLFEKAGHAFYADEFIKGLKLGGSKSENIDAYKKSYALLLNFLDKIHGSY